MCRAYGVQQGTARPRSARKLQPQLQPPRLLQPPRRSSRLRNRGQNLLPVTTGLVLLEAEHRDDASFGELLELRELRNAPLLGQELPEPRPHPLIRRVAVAGAVVLRVAQRWEVNVPDPRPFKVARQGRLGQ